MLARDNTDTIYNDLNRNQIHKCYITWLLHIQRVQNLVEKSLTDVYYIVHFMTCVYVGLQIFMRRKKATKYLSN